MKRKEDSGPKLRELQQLKENNSKGELIEEEVERKPEKYDVLGDPRKKCFEVGTGFSEIFMTLPWILESLRFLTTQSWILMI